MDIMNDYTNFNVLDFAEDEMFQEWVLRPSEENNKFWNDVIESQPSKTEAIENAIKLVSSIHFKEEWPEDKRVESSLNKFLKIVSKKNHTIHRVISFKPWMVAASALIILASGILYFYINKSQSHSGFDNVAKNIVHKNDIAPGGNKAVLTLANGSTIVLDSTQNGLLTQQGNANVLKLNDGELTYREDENSSAFAVQYNTITTPRGGKYQLVLADGSKVWLNAESSIRFPTVFTGEKRGVEITGEAYFEISHNASVPFHVMVNNMDVVVLGTHFNVNAYDDEGVMKTTLLEGSVIVSSGNENVLIKPGEQAQIKNSIDKIIVKKGVDMEEVVAWKNNKFIFQGTNIRVIMRQLERWYNITTVSYAKNTTNEEFIGVISRDANISQILNMLERTGIVKFEIEGRKIIVK